MCIGILTICDLGTFDGGSGALAEGRGLHCAVESRYCSSEGKNVEETKHSGRTNRKP